MPARWPYCRFPTGERCLERRKPARLATLRLALLVPAVGMYSSDTRRLKRSSEGYPPIWGQCTPPASRQLSLELFWNASQTPAKGPNIFRQPTRGEQREKEPVRENFCPIFRGTNSLRPKAPPTPFVRGW